MGLHLLFPLRSRASRATVGQGRESIRIPRQNPCDSTRISHKLTVQDRTPRVAWPTPQRTNAHEIKEKRSPGRPPCRSASFHPFGLQFPAGRFVLRCCVTHGPGGMRTLPKAVGFERRSELREQFRSPRSANRHGRRQSLPVRQFSPVRPAVPCGLFCFEVLRDPRTGRDENLAEGPRVRTQERASRAIPIPAQVMGAECQALAARTFDPAPDSSKFGGRPANPPGSTRRPPSLFCRRIGCIRHPASAPPSARRCGPRPSMRPRRCWSGACRPAWKRRTPPSSRHTSRRRGPSCASSGSR